MSVIQLILYQKLHKIKMPIKSYILHCEATKKDLLLHNLKNTPNCEVIPAKNHELIVLVTDAATEELDKELHNQLQEMEGLKHMSLVSGFNPK